MSVENKFIITAAQKVALEALSNPTSIPPVYIAPRAIDTASPGVGINLNPDATEFEAGAVVELVGKFVAPKRIIDDPAYITNAAAMVAYLRELPFAILEDETVHAPEPPIDI
ncbi:MULTISPECIES: hypothetical protein [unclassified Chelatococcus]|uniref:hypothetical protein n=1 Tax=unclassified Chelatococcus TaxID=2638111 RepID=UPI001BCB9B57|nr:MULTISPECIES: hypothetical protein [unclassified Chelatococcus]MBS7699147.1 hypothetical protein [Chelatococcus sp. YT9]MBX3554928.1 hypothetical protein [Chelatococcus sp.]